MAQQQNARWGENTVKGTMATKVKVLTKDYILHVSYMYWFIKYQNYILILRPNMIQINKIYIFCRRT